MRSRLSIVAASVALVAPLTLSSMVSAATKIDSRDLLDSLENGQIVDDEFEDGPFGFTLSASPGDLVAYDVNEPRNGDANDLNPAGQIAGLGIILIDQEPGNPDTIGLGTECGCIPDDAIGGEILIEWNSPVVEFSTWFVDVENEEGPDSRLVFTDSSSGATSTVSVQEMTDPGSPFYQGPDFILGDSLPQLMINPITATQLGHAFDVMQFDMAGSEALGPFSFTNAVLSVGSTVFSDDDDSGTQNGAERGLPGLTVELLDENDVVVATTETDANGDWFIDADSQDAPLLPGDYRIRVEAPSATAVVSSTTSPADSAVDGTNDATQAAPGGLATTGLFTLEYGSDPTEDAQGGEQDDGPFDADGDMTIDIGFVPDPAPPASLGDVVFFDTDGDGQQDTGEDGVPGVQVILLTDDDGNGSADTQLTSTTTGAAGEYGFQDLDPSLDYVVRFVAPDGFDFTAPDQGDDTTDSDADPATGFTSVIELDPGENDPTIDAGLVESTVEPELASLGDVVFFDTDGDGQQDPGEPGVTGARVALWIDDGGDGTPDTQVTSTTTGDDGSYGFDGLTPGVTYIVQFVAPTGQRLTVADQGDDASDSDADPATGLTGGIVLEPGENDPTIDAGLVADGLVLLLGTIGDTVFRDLDGDGVQDSGDPGIPGVVITLTDADGRVVATETTDADGVYLFEDVPEGAYTVTLDPVTAPDPATSSADPDGGDPLSSSLSLGEGEVDLDQDFGFTSGVTSIIDGASVNGTVYFDNDTDGTRDPGEPGIIGVTVRLESPDGSVVSTTTTGQNGEFEFPDVPSGTYDIVVDENTIPDGYVQTGDPDGVLDATTSVDVTTGPTDAGDFGYDTSTGSGSDDPSDPTTPTTPVSTPTGDLPATGSTILPGLVAALLAFVGGLTLLVIGRRRGDHVEIHRL